MTNVLSHRFKRESSRFTCDRTREADWPTGSLVVDDRFDFTLRCVDGLQITEQSEARAKLTEFNLLAANIEMEFYLRREGAVAIG